MPSADLINASTNLQKAVAWLGETLRLRPDRPRGTVIAEAGLRFDLTPAECGFLKRNFQDDGCGQPPA
jgi:hypothetical protein